MDEKEVHLWVTELIERDSELAELLARVLNEELHIETDENAFNKMFGDLTLEDSLWTP